jgi:membrane protein DedA with SNARE-associated domain
MFPVFLGARFGHRLLLLKPFCWIFKKQAVDESMMQLRNHGKWVIFLTRFIPLIRGPIYFSIGLSQMSIRKFVCIDAFASCFQIPALLWIGSTIGRRANSLMEGYQRIGWLMVGLAVVTFSLKWILSRRNA